MTRLIFNALLRSFVRKMPMLLLILLLSWTLPPDNALALNVACELPLAIVGEISDSDGFIAVRVNVDFGELGVIENEPDPSPGEGKLGADPGIFFDGAKLGFIGNSFMGAWGGVNNYLELVASHASVPASLETIPAGGWFWGLELSSMFEGLKQIEMEGDYDTCVFLDGPLDTMREFADKLFAVCDHVVLMVDGGGQNPGMYNDATLYKEVEQVLANARVMEAEYPALHVIPLAYIYYELSRNPPTTVPDDWFLHGTNDIHQNGLGTLVNAFAIYTVMTNQSPVGIQFEWDEPAFYKFAKGNAIGLSSEPDPYAEERTVELTPQARDAFQQRVVDYIIEWRAGTTEFD